MKYVLFTAEVRCYGAYGLCGVRVASVINNGKQDATNKSSTKCFSIFYNNITAHDLLYHEKRIAPTWVYCFNGGFTTTVR